LLGLAARKKDWAEEKSFPEEADWEVEKAY
jgi:hypothetical protein